MNKPTSEVNIYRCQLVKEAAVEWCDDETVLDNPEKVVEFMEELRPAENAEEYIWCIAMNTRGKPAGVHEIAHGGVGMCAVKMCDIFKRALLNNAASIILMHNHPAGDPEPSSEDICVTGQAIEVGRLLGVPVQDHIVIAAEGFVSIREKDPAMW